MSKMIINDTTLTNIANAIRTKADSQDTYTPSEMVTAISNLGLIITNGTSAMYLTNSGTISPNRFVTITNGKIDAATSETNIDGILVTEATTEKAGKVYILD